MSLIINKFFHETSGPVDTSLEPLNEVYFGKQPELLQLEQGLEKLRSIAASGNMSDALLQKATYEFDKVLKPLFNFNHISVNICDYGTGMVATDISANLIRTEFDNTYNGFDPKKVITSTDDDLEDMIVNIPQNASIKNKGFYDSKTMKYKDPHKIDFLVVTENGIKIQGLTANLALYIDRQTLLTDIVFKTAGEAVAVILHEIGHNFQTYFFANSKSKVKIPALNLELFKYRQNLRSSRAISKSASNKADVITDFQLKTLNPFPDITLLAGEHFADQFAAMYGYGPEFAQAMYNFACTQEMIPASRMDSKDINIANINKKLKPFRNIYVDLGERDDPKKQIRRDRKMSLDYFYKSGGQPLMAHPATFKRIDGVINQMKEDLKDKLLSPQKRAQLKHDIKITTDIRRDFRSNKRKKNETDEEKLKRLQIAYHKQLGKDYIKKNMRKQVLQATDPKAINTFFNNFRQS